jgi:hypothetical protein
MRHRSVVTCCEVYKKFRKGIHADKLPESVRERCKTREKPGKEPGHRAGITIAYRQLSAVSSKKKATASLWKRLLLRIKDSNEYE